MTDRPIKSTLPGIFYRQANPGDRPFVAEGDTVAPGDVIGIVEIMKSFHEVATQEGGVLRVFLVENEDAVEVGQDLAILEV